MGDGVHMMEDVELRLDGKDVYKAWKGELVWGKLLSMRKNGSLGYVPPDFEDNSA